MTAAKGTRQAGSFFQTDKDMVKSDVYRSLHLASRAILVELQAMHSGVRNNGWIMLGVIEAGRRIGMANKSILCAAFHELEDKGFIARTWSPDGDKALIRQGYASTWLLTFHDAEIAGRKIAASDAWLKWNGRALKPPKLPEIYPPDRAEQYGKKPLPVEPKPAPKPTPKPKPQPTIAPKMSRSDPPPIRMAASGGARHTAYDPSANPF